MALTRFPGQRTATLFMPSSISGGWLGMVTVVIADAKKSSQWLESSLDADEGQNSALTHI